MAFQVDGKLHKVFDTEQKSANFRAREFVIEVADGKYPQMVKFQLTQDKCELIDSHKEGEELTVHFDLRGREWNDRYFTNLNAWRIESAAAAAADNTAPPATATTTPAGDEFMDDVPF